MHSFESITYQNNESHNFRKAHAIRMRIKEIIRINRYKYILMTKINRFIAEKRKCTPRSALRMWLTESIQVIPSEPPSFRHSFAHSFILSLSLTHSLISFHSFLLFDACIFALYFSYLSLFLIERQVSFVRLQCFE